MILAYARNSSAGSFLEAFREIGTSGLSCFHGITHAVATHDFGRVTLFDPPTAVHQIHCLVWGSTASDSVVYSSGLVFAPPGWGTISSSLGSDKDVLGEVGATSFLYETPPMYLTNQPPFLNGACRLVTELDPPTLLHQLKRLEASVGRVESTRWGPRAVDIDILLYDDRVVSERGRERASQAQGPDRQRWLEIPHPRMHERPFVLRPLADIAARTAHPVHKHTVGKLLEAALWIGGEDASAAKGEKVLPLGVSKGETRLWRLEGARSRTYVMGILNVTPDSFSDGGRHTESVEKAVEFALSMVRDGADIIDVGGESTRPGADEISEEQELSRVLPVIQGICGAGITVSVDTRRASVAAAAIAAGAHLVNDVSGGEFDPAMLKTVAEAGVPLVMMHMRGTPQTMASLTDYGGDTVGKVCDALRERTRAAEQAGIPRWMHVLDPGIGFAKTPEQSLLLLRKLDDIGSRLGNPLLVGPSRKRFIGQVTGEDEASQRDWGTVGACCAAAERGASILRVHNARGVAQALAVSDAIRNAVVEGCDA